MKKYFYTSILSVFFFMGCSSEFTEEPIIDPEVPTDSFEELLISEIATFINTDNSKRNHYVELYNGTDKVIDLSNYAIGYQATSDESTLAEWSFTDPNNYLQLSGSLATQKAYVIASVQADPAIIKSNVTWGTSSTASADASKPLQLSGNSAIALLKKDAAGTHTLNGEKYKIIDVFGSPKVARVTAATSSSRNNFMWTIAGESAETRNNTFTRKSTIRKPNTDWAVSKGSSASNSEWNISPARAWDYSNVGFFTGSSTTPTNPYQEILISEIATFINTDPNAGGKRNHYIELYNGTDNAIDLSNYAIGYQATTDEATLAEWSFTDATNYLLLTGSLASVKTHVIASVQADAAFVKGDVTWGTTSTANADASKPLQLSGNSAIALLKKDAAGPHTLNGVKYKIIDVFGSPKVARVTATASSSSRNNFMRDIAGEKAETRNNTIFRKKTITQPNTDWAKSKGTSATDSEWILSAARTWDYSNIGKYTN